MAPGIGGAVYEGCASCFRPDIGLPALPDAGRSDVLGREVYLNSEASGLVGLSSFVGLGVKVSSPMAGRGLGLALPDGIDFDGLPPALAAFFRRSSVARRRASRASSSEVWLDTARFLDQVVRVRSNVDTGNILLRYSGIKVCYAVVDFEQIVQCKRKGSSHG